VSLQTYGWLVVAFPLGGTVLIALTWNVLPWKLHGYLGTLAIFLSFLSSVGALFQLQDLGEEDRQFYRWYGPWAPLTPAEVAARLEGLDACWWIVGGWAVDAFTGVSREHEDVDVAFLRDERWVRCYAVYQAGLIRLPDLVQVCSIDKEFHISPIT